MGRDPAQSGNSSHCLDCQQHRACRLVASSFNQGKPMNKIRSDSQWNKLSYTQKELIERWLLEENLSYTQMLERAREQFAIVSSKTSLWRFCQAIYRRKVRADLCQTQSTAQAANESTLDLAAVRTASFKLIGKRLLDSALHDSVENKELSSLASILLLHEQQEIQRGWLRLAQEKYQYRAAEAALKAAPTVTELDKENEERELARIDHVKRALFGKELDKVYRTKEEQQKYYEELLKSKNVPPAVPTQPTAIPPDSQ